jgi:excisionase family DNA binding protein
MTNSISDSIAEGKKALLTIQLYSPPECAAILGVSLPTVSRWLRSGALPALRLGPSRHLWRVRHQDLENFIEKGRTAPDGSLPDSEDQSEASDDD